MIIDVLFSLDIFVNMRSTFISEKTGAEITDGKTIARNYIFGGRFVVDLMASIPFDAILPKGGNTQILGLLKLVRLLRLGRIVTFMKMRQGLKLGFKIF